MRLIRLFLFLLKRLALPNKPSEHQGSVAIETTFHRSSLIQEAETFKVYKYSSIIFE